MSLLQPKWAMFQEMISLLLITPKNIYLKACETSLKKLRREAIDYYQLHSARIAAFARRGMYCCNATTGATG